MLRFIIHRILYSVLVIWLAVTFTFFVIRLAPGGPFDSEKPLPPAVLKNVQRAYGLDRPLYEQYLKSMWGVMRFDFGPSLTSRHWNVNEKVFGALPYSIKVGLLSYILSVVFAVVAGTISALNRGNAIDKSITLVSLAGASVPTIVSGPLAIILFAVHLHWLPAGGWGDGSFRNLLLPVALLTLALLPYKTKIMRNSMIETLNKPYMLTARSKGLNRSQAIVQHAMLPALTPIIVIIGVGLGGAILGSFIIEAVFSLPGTGKLVVQSAGARDYPVITTMVILSAFLLVIGNMISDLLLAIIDPRVRKSEIYKS